MHYNDKTFKVGSATVKIEQDQDCESPLEWSDKNVIFATLDPRSTLKPDWAKQPEDLTAYAKENKYWEIPLFKYEHGSVIYKIGQHNPFTCPWDSGRVGSILLAKSEWKRVKAATKFAEGLCESVTDWCNGNCWGYVISVPDEEHVESCWGYIGDFDAKHIVDDATAAAKYAAGKYDEQQAREQEAARPDLYELDPEYNPLHG